MSGNHDGFLVGERQVLPRSSEESVDAAAAVVVDERVVAVEESVPGMQDVRVCEEHGDVGVRVCGRRRRSWMTSPFSATL